MAWRAEDVTVSPYYSPAARSSGASWQRVDDNYWPMHASDVRPAPPRPPRLAALMARSTGPSGSFRLSSERREEDQVHHFPCWRLRWCAFCLVIAATMQASTVGSRMQQLYVDGAGRNMMPQLVGDVVLLSLLLIALWSLLSQLLLWSDAAVMKVPEGVRVRNTSEQESGSKSLV